MLRPPIEVQRPERVSALPKRLAGDWLIQVKLDGWRVIAFVDDGEVTLQTRSGRTVTHRFPEVLPALLTLEPGTVLDGEVVAVRGGRFDFHALASPPRVRAATGVAVSYVAFDLLADRGEDVRSWPLEDRWTRLLARLHGAPGGLEPVMSTLDRGEAEEWLEALASIGAEGLVVKDLRVPYRAGVGHGWKKMRASDTIDATLVGVVGPGTKPTALRVEFDDGHTATTATLSTARRAELMTALQLASDGPIRVEVHVTGYGGRHEMVEFVRVRLD